MRVTELGLRGKKVFVGGGTKGIGKSVAEGFAKEGAEVHLAARKNSASVATEIEERFGAEVRGYDFDLSDAKSVARLADEIGPVDVLFINTGGPKPGEIEDLTEDDWKNACDLTLMSAVRLANAFLPSMISKGWGRMVALTSISVFEPIPRLLLSNSLRLAVEGFMRSLSKEHGSDGITFNCVAPGYTLTDRIKTLFEDTAKNRGTTAGEAAVAVAGGTDLKRLAEPSEIADAVLFLSSERASYISGVTLRVDGGYVASTL